MSTRNTRARVALPAELVAEIDAFVGPRARSQFIAEAAEARLQRERQTRALEIGFGAWKDEDHPELNGPEGTVGWVRQLREEENRHLEEILGERLPGRHNRSD